MSMSTTSTPLASAIYRGHVRHRRHAPHAHAFRYAMFFMYLDLDELDRVFAGRWLWSINRFNLAQFRRSDYHGDPTLPLADAVRATVQARLGRAPAGPIRLLTHLRYFGHCFNPVSFYYCFEADGVTLDVIVAEITNTPWKERHAYVLPVGDAERHGSALHFAFEKQFHVSPFLPMQRHYDWHFQVPDDDLRVHMDVSSDSGRQFDATLVLAREPISARGLAYALLRYPFITLRVVLAIHWQALVIWCKQNPVYAHVAKTSPEKSKVTP